MDSLKQLKFFSADSSMVLEIADDNFSAYLTIKEEKEFINEAEIMDLIKRAGINYGFERATEFANKNKLIKEINRPFPIAIGERNQHPSVEFSPLFEESTSFNPEMFKNQFNDLKNYFHAEKGLPLAHLFITKPAKPGRNIFGVEIGSDQTEQDVLNHYLGSNVIYSQERSQIIAAESGYPYVDELERVHVMSEFVIQGNLGLEYENFTLRSNLEIHGSIKDKIRVQIDGNLRVFGDINDAEVEVNGLLHVDGDILNCKSGGVRVNGNVEFESAENSRIACSGDIVFSKFAQFCNMIAGKNIIGNEMNSALIGGLAQAGENIEVAVIGSSNAIGTEVEITISPYVKEQMLRITKRLMTLRGKPTQNVEEIRLLTDKQQLLESELEKEINKTLLNDDTTPRHIMAFRKVYSGTYLRILKKSQTILEEMNKVSFSIENGELSIDEY